MKDIIKNWEQSKLKRFLTSPVAVWFLALFFYCLITVLFMGSAATSCSTTIFGYPGDGSGGVGWFQWADGGGPIWGLTHMSNYPFGEQLNRPQFITSYALYVPYSLLSLMTNSACGLNVMVFIGFLSTALVTFGLVRWITRQTIIALFAGFAAAFVPYHYLQTQGHQAYGYGSIFAAIIWSFLWFRKQPSVQRIMPLAILYIYSFYMDGYFVLLSTGLIGVLSAVYILEGVFKYKKTHKATWLGVDARRLWVNIQCNYKIIATGILICLALLLPIIYKQVRHGSEIQQELSSSRSNIVSETMMYGTRMSDFFLPSIHSVFVDEHYIDWRVNNIHNSNPAEATLYVGYTLLLLIWGLIVYSLTKKGKRDSTLKIYKPVINVSAMLIVVLTLFSLPPHFEFLGVAFSTPTQLLIEVTEKWRVVARFFMITHVAMVVIASIAMIILTNLLPKRVRVWAIIMLFVMLFVEYFPAHTYNWSYVRDTPKVYHEIANDKFIHVMAEYPIVDHPSTTLPFTFTFQQTHGKPLLNANSGTTNQSALRRSIAGLGDVQTVGVLRGLGIDVVTTLNIDGSVVPGLETYMQPEDNFSIGKVYSYRITDGPISKYALIAKHGFNTTFDKTKLKSSQDMMNSSIMTIETVGKNVFSKNTTSYLVKFQANAFDGGAQLLTIKQMNKKVWAGVVQDRTEVSFEVESPEALYLTVPGYYNTPSLSIENMSVEAR